jgi:hypothetical protein
MLREGPLVEVLRAVERPAYKVRIVEPPARAIETLSRLSGVDDVTLDEDSDDIVFRCEGGAEAASDVAAALLRDGLHLAHFGEVEGSLEATFVKLLRPPLPLGEGGG